MEKMVTSLESDVASSCDPCSEAVTLKLLDSWCRIFVHFVDELTPPENWYITLKLMAGRWHFLRENGPFSGDMLIFW